MELPSSSSPLVKTFLICSLIVDLYLSEKIGHLLLCQPDRFSIRGDVEPESPIIRLIEQDLGRAFGESSSRAFPICKYLLRVFTDANSYKIAKCVVIKNGRKLS